MTSVDGNGDVMSSPDRLVFAYYVTGHGFGHATRVVEVARHLIAAGHHVHVVTGAPQFVFTTEINSPNLHIRKNVLDSGAVQVDALTVDPVASLEAYSQRVVVPRASILATEVEWLKSIKANLVVSDVVPVACRAAADAGIRSICVTNFSWDFIYAEYVMAAGHHHRSIVWQIAEDYSHCEFVLRLPGYCPMPAFRDVIDVPLVVRVLRKSRSEVREELGIGNDVKLVIFNFGGQQAKWKLKEDWLPEGWLCLVCGASDTLELPPNFIKLPKDAYTPDLIAASDCMLGKIGYGTVSEALAFKLPFVFVRRDYFNEEPFLRNMLEHYESGVEMIRRDFLSGQWTPYLVRALNLSPCYDGVLNGGEVVARTLEDTAFGKYYSSHKDTFGTEAPFFSLPNSPIFLPTDLSGCRIESEKQPLIKHGETGYNLTSPDPGLVDPCCTKVLLLLKLGSKLDGTRRLHDAIIMGYQLQRASGRDMTIPDWYTLPKHEVSGHPEVNESSPLVESHIENFEILHGKIHGLSDTQAFLRILSDLHTGIDQGKHPEKLQLREQIAAAIIFNWEEEIYVARAPGRLDVMGGIADYSGSLVLQMPIREACHVAVQRNHPSKQKLWKHALARQQAKGQGPVPTLQIVSFGSDLSNRGPTFDMDLEDLMDGEQPISYEKAYDYFSHDPSQKWAAYVAGTVLVLMSELGVNFTDSISILVSSDVPEGKGVSSSAAVEVSTMSAIAAAHGLDISPRDLALLCQKVENCIVGAPCGVMDQMASACGEANKLLAMVCQPAEIKGMVSIPTHIRFWGLDSGIKHSVGGADYGSVRIGTFMGRKIIKSTASASLSSSPVSMTSPQDEDELNCHEYEKHGMGLLKAEASLDYLCNLSTHRYEGVYGKKLPESILGESFLEQYITHEDSVTIIDPRQIYAVKAPTKHPVYENFRVEAFKVLLRAQKTDDQYSTLGELMYQCHYSYSDCGLGSDGTDRLVELVQQMQYHRSCHGNQNLFGAKITGGGSGGTVCIIGRNCSQSNGDILEIQERYKASTGYMPFLFDGSSPGAGKFGYLKLRRRPLENKNPDE